MRFLHRLTLAVALLGTAGPLTGCPKTDTPSFSEEDLDTKPRPNFQMGVSTLQSADRKGQVNYQAAYDYFVKADNLGAGPKNAFNAAWTAQILGRSEDAEKYYRKAFEADPSYKAAMYSLAETLKSNGKSAEAVSIYKGYLDNHPTDLEVRTDLIGALTSAGMYDEAEVQAGEILLQDPKSAAAYQALSAMYFNKGELGMSALCNEKALQLNEGDSGTYNNLGVTDLLQEAESQAIGRFKQAVQLNSKHYEANTNLGYIALRSGDYTLAKASLEKAVEADPSSNVAKLGLAVAYRGTGDYDRAETLYKEIIVSDPSNENAYRNAAKLHAIYTKDFAKAVKYLQDYVDANTVGPGHPVFAEMENIKSLQAKEKQRIEEEAAREKAIKEREERNKKLLSDMNTVVQKYTAGFSANQGCIDEMVAEEGAMILEQAAMIIEMGDVDMAGDINMMLEGYTPVWDEAIAGCGGGGAAPAPEEGGDEAPAEEAPAEEGGE